ncbi:MAG: CRISPR-associated endonuclease Cas2 [Nocardia sp.]|nr:CRISPR-associated endonuclease Cas2 [Nocardia sp.]
MSDKVHRYILAYDVAHDAHRTRVAKTLESYGDRIQYSVFLVDAKPAKMVRLRAAVTAAIELATDSLLVADLGPLSSDGGKRIQFVGITRRFLDQGPLIL